MEKRAGWALRTPSPEVGGQDNRAVSTAPHRPNASSARKAHPALSQGCASASGDAFTQPDAKTSASTLPDVELRRFGRWAVINTDTVGKRALCRCDCGALREIAIAALADGSTTSCGCGPSRSRPPTRRGASTFASAIAGAESGAAIQTFELRAHLHKIYPDLFDPPKIERARS